MKQRAIAAAVAMTCIWGGAARGLAADPTRALVDSVRSGENRQTDIKSETQRTISELDAIIAEFDRSGLGDGADVQVLKSIRGVLGTLTDKEMQRVIALLQSARSAPDGRAATLNATEAVQGQKTIVIQLQQLLLEYQRQQELTALSLRFASLAEDQHKNMKATRGLARVARTGSLTEEQNVMLILQQSEEAAIRDQVASQLKKLEELGKDADGTTEPKIAKVLESAQQAGLSSTLTQATSDLMQARLFSAAVKEKAARDQLRNLARVVAPPREPMAIIQEAIDVLTVAIAEQKNVLDATRTLDGADAAAKAVDLEERQADLVDGTDLVRRDIAELALEAADELKTSQDKMQLTRAALGAKPQKDAAADNATAAMAGLERARTRLVDQLALLKKQNAENNTLEQAKLLKEQIVALREAQERLKAQTAKPDSAPAQLGPRQGELTGQAKDILLLVTTEAPAATEPMQNAARNMDDARLSLSTTPNRTEAAKSQQSAIENLLKAEKALDQQIAELEKAKEDLAKLEEARDQVAKALVKEQKIERDTAKMAAKQQKPDAPKEPKKPEEQPKPDEAKADEPKPNEAKADAQKPDEQAKTDEKKGEQAPQEMNAADQQKAADLANLQQEAAKDTAAAKDNVAQANNDAANALDSAKKNMDAAKGGLDAKNAPAANADAQNAVADLNKAKQALDDKIGELQDKLGEQKDDAGALDDLAGKLEKAQSDLAAAQRQMDGQPDQNQMNQAGEKMDNVAGELSKAAADDKGALPQPAEKAINDANNALSKAAAAAGKGDKDEAQKQAGEAQKALGQAQAAVAMAQQGMPGQPGQPMAGPPGQTPGNMPGKMPGAPGKADEKNAQKGKGDRKDANVNADSKTGGPGARGSSAFMGLPAREREAVLQDRKERYPQEYAPMIEQYAKDLSDSDR